MVQERRVSLWVRDPQVQQRGPRQQNQRQKPQAQSRAPSPCQVEEDSHEVLLAALSGLVPNTLLEQVRTSLPEPEKPLTERMMQVQNRLNEEKRSVNSWREAVKVREASLAEGRKMLSDHVTKVEALQAEMSSLETQFIAQRKEKEEEERKEVEEKLAATQVDMQHTPIPDEDVDMEDYLGRGGVKKARRNADDLVLSYEQLEVNIMRSMEALGTKPEDYLAMIQRCLNKKALQESGESPKSSERSGKDVVEEDPNL